MHKAHETIWLQVDPDGESCNPEQWNLEDDVTWCKDQINANDVEYVRADIAETKLAAEQAKNVRLLEAFTWARSGFKKAAGGFLSQKHLEEHLCLCNEALSTPPDTSALEAVVERAGEVMRERIRIAKEQGWLDKELIRKLPAVTLEDLK